MKKLTFNTLFIIILKNKLQIEISLGNIEKSLDLITYGAVAKWFKA